MFGQLNWLYGSFLSICVRAASETAQEVIVVWRSMLTNLEWETEGEE